jgi:hypothetical protein
LTAWEISEIYLLDFGKVILSTVRLDMACVTRFRSNFIIQSVRIDGHQTKFHAHILNLDENTAGDLLLGQNCLHM